MLAADGRLNTYPIEDAAKVDARRALLGLPSLRDQLEAIGLLPMKAEKILLGSAQAFVPESKLEPAAGLNSKGDVKLGEIYIHSRDDGSGIAAVASCGASPWLNG